MPDVFEIPIEFAQKEKIKGKKNSFVCYGINWQLFPIEIVDSFFNGKRLEVYLGFKEMQESIMIPFKVRIVI